MPQAFSREIVLDKIVARVNGKNILKSSLEENRLIKDAKPFTLDEMIKDEVTVQKAEELRTVPSAAELSATFASEKIAYGGKTMSDEAFEDSKLKSLGLNLAQYKNQLYRYVASEYLLSTLITKKLVIPAQDIEDYYNANLEYTEEQYHIFVADAPGGRIKPMSADWSDLGWFEKHELSDDLKKLMPSLLKAKLGTPKSLVINGKSSLVMLKEYKKPEVIPLSERYFDIKNHLRDQRRDPFVKEFIANAKNQAYITYP